MTSEEYRHIRLTLGLSQNELARRLNVTAACISHRENSTTGKPLNMEAILALRCIVEDMERFPSLFPDSHARRNEKVLERYVPAEGTENPYFPEGAKAPLESPRLEVTANSVKLKEPEPDWESLSTQDDDITEEEAAERYRELTGQEPQDDPGEIETTSVDEPECWRIYGLAPGKTEESCLDGWKGQIKTREIAEGRIEKLVGMGCKSLTIKGEKLN